MKQDVKSTTFLVQHMEPYLFQWCLSQYKAMKEYLKHSPAKLIITNAKVIFQYNGEHCKENTKHLQELLQCFAEDKEKYQLQKQSLQQKSIQFQGKIGMLDMRGEKELSIDQQWDYIVFGGILGDHPPRDRPAPLRKNFVDIRHLGSMQLATDTAVLVSRLILFNQIPLSKIPMIDAPTIKGLNKNGEKTTVQMEGFSYISKQLDINQGKMIEGLTKKQKKQVYMSQGVRNLLLCDDLDQNLLM